MGILKVLKPFLNHNNMERLSNGPNWVLLRRVPSGDKTFLRFLKVRLQFLKRKVQVPFLKRNQLERIKWSPLGSALQSPFSGLKPRIAGALGRPRRGTGPGNNFRPRPRRGPRPGKFLMPRPQRGLRPV